MAEAQLPNEKFGKPSNLEWEFVGWGEAIHADALILCKTMTVTYQLSDQVFNNNQAFSDVGFETIDDFGKNQIDYSNILVKYECKLRTKILKPDGAKHANIDITYYEGDNFKMANNDELKDLNIKVFLKNEKGKADSQIFNIGNPNNNYSIRELAEIVIDEMKKFPRFADKAAAAKLNIISPEKYYSGGYDDTKNRIPSIEKIKQLGWAPQVSLRDAVRMTLEAYHE